MTLEFVITAFGALLVALGVAGLFVPASFRKMNAGWPSQGRFATAILLRFVLGGLLIYVADLTRFPVVFKILGGISVAVAVVIAIMGRSMLDRMLGWWMSKPDGFLRLLALLAAAFGAFLVYATT